MHQKFFSICAKAIKKINFLAFPAVQEIQFIFQGICKSLRFLRFEQLLLSLANSKQRHFDFYIEKFLSLSFKRFLKTFFECYRVIELRCISYNFPSNFDETCFSALKTPKFRK